MVEAMDDSYIFATSLTGLQFFCLQMEHFQFAYNWLTQWSKTSVFVLEDPAISAEKIVMPSITRTAGKDPWNITYHPVEVIHDQLEMLRTFVNDSENRFQAISDFIQDFSFPKFTVRSPITLLRKITMQNIASRARAMLALQPIKQKQAELLDHKLANKIHKCLGFPFRPNSDILTLPIKLMGFEFPSIAKINLALAIEGLARDLNHHIPSYQRMARITLADWQCSMNDCVNPVDAIKLNRKWSQFYRKLPVHWIEAQRGLSKLSLMLRRTDQSFVASGMVSISHLSRRNGNAIHGKTIIALRERGFYWLSQVGSIDNNWKLNVCCTPPNDGKSNYQDKQIWEKLKNALNGVGITRCVDGISNGLDLLLSREDRQLRAERAIGALALMTSLKPSVVRSGNHGENWASDGSMKPATAGPLEDKTITCAITGPTTLVLKIKDKASSILQGELMGMIGSSVLANSSDNQSSTVFSDHMNTTRIIDDHRAGSNTTAKLRFMPGRSYYRWLINLLDRKPMLKVQYTPGHSKDLSSDASQLNFKADHYASRASSADIAWKVPLAPVPTFFRDEYSVYEENLGWIESNIKSLVISLMDRSTAKTLGMGHRYRMATWLYDNGTPPLYPYTRAPSAFSAAVQLYIRSGQLPTADNLRQKRMRVSNLCRFGCIAVEDIHHIFSNCITFKILREEAAKEAELATSKLLEKSINETDMSRRIMEIAKYLFSDSEQYWPLARSQYYLGHTPKINWLVRLSKSLSTVKQEKLAQNVHSLWHVHSIQLAGRIWGEVLRRVAPNKPK